MLTQCLPSQVKTNNPEGPPDEPPAPIPSAGQPTNAAPEDGARPRLGDAATLVLPPMNWLVELPDSADDPVDVADARPPWLDVTECWLVVLVRFEEECESLTDLDDDGATTTVLLEASEDE